MAGEHDFFVRNGLVVNNYILFANSNSARVGINNSAPDASLTVTGTANVSGNVVLGGQTVHVGIANFSANVTGNNNNSYLDGFIIDLGTFS